MKAEKATAAATPAPPRRPAAPSPAPATEAKGLAAPGRLEVEVKWQLKVGKYHPAWRMEMYRRATVEGHLSIKGLPKMLALTQTMVTGEVPTEQQLMGHGGS